MRDPDCPQPHWLRQVLSLTGFRVDDSSGTFLARSGDVQFYIWVEEAEQVPDEHLTLVEDPGSFPLRETIGGVTVYGNDFGREWRAGPVHVYVSWADAPWRPPTIEELEPVVEASLRVPYPPRTM